MKYEKCIKLKKSIRIEFRSESKASRFGFFFDYYYGRSIAFLSASKASLTAFVNGQKLYRVISVIRQIMDSF